MFKIHWKGQNMRLTFFNTLDDKQKTYKVQIGGGTINIKIIDKDTNRNKNNYDIVVFRTKYTFVLQQEKNIL